jgi:peptide/nickel transport system permease protein
MSLRTLSAGRAAGDDKTGSAVTAAVAPPAKPRRPRRVGLWIGLSWVGLVLLLAIFADLLPIADPNVNIGRSRMHPFDSFQLNEILGTDANGRSVLSRLIFGARTSLLVSTASVLFGLVIGGAIGLVAGYLRGLMDRVVGLLTDTLLAFPGLIILLALAATMGPGIRTLVIGLTLVAVPQFARVGRANAIRSANREFVQAARLMGAKPRRVLSREILPNIVPPLLAYAVVVIATLIVAEASLSYLGVGIRPPAPSWGGMISDGQDELRRNPQLVLIPSAVLFITVYAFNLIGDWARSKFDIGDSKL